MKNLMYFIFVGCFFFSLQGYANQCTKAKNKAEKKCDEKELASARAKLQAALATVNGTEHGAARNIEEHAYPTAENARDEVVAKRVACEQLISDCKTKCDQVYYQNISNPQTQQIAQQAEQDKKFCTEGKPKEFAEQAKKDEKSMGDALKGLMDMLKALMGMGGDETQKAEEDPCDNPHPDDPRCKTDVASTDKPGEFADGEFRSDDAGLIGDAMALDGASPAAGTPVEPAYSKGLGGAAAGAGLGTASLDGSPSGEREAGSNNLEEGSKIGPAGYMGGGGGGGRGGYGSAGSGNGGDNNNAPVTVSSVDQSKIHAAVSDKLDQRGPAAIGPRGGISGALSMDNFRKVERRVEYERKSLDDL